MDILRGNTVIATVHPTDDSIYSCKLMGDNCVKLNFRVAATIDLQIGDHIVWRNQNFYLNQSFPIKEVSTREIEYNCEFQAVDYDLLKTGYKLFDNTSTPLQGDFPLTGNALKFVQLLVDNLNRNDDGWSVGNVLETDVKTLTFSGENCMEVLQKLATEFETEYYITSSKVVSLFKKPWQGSVITLAYGIGQGLKWLRRINRDTEPIITCLFAYGSSRNLPYGYRNGASRLMLPGNGYLLQNVSQYGVRESDIIYEEIYPRLAAGDGNDPGKVTATTGFLKFTDANLDFDVNDTLTSETAKVKFNSGELAGYEFDIESFNYSTKTFTVIAADKEGITLPSASISAAVGDKYVLLNIKMPQSYVDRAELELAEKALEYLNEYSHIRESYNAECDILYFKSNNIKLVSGQVVRIQSSALGIDREIRVIGFSQNLNEQYKNEMIEFGEKPIPGKLDKLSSGLSSAAAAVAASQRLNWQTTLELIQLINNASTVNEFSTITGLPIDNEMLAKYLNAFPDAKTQIISGAIVWDHDLTYQATDIEYKILGVTYMSKAREITLSAASATLSRIDAFYVDVFGNLNVAQGTPATNPATPILSSIQLQVMTVLLSPGATVPSDLTLERIYDEGATGEWSKTSNQDTYVSIDLNSADAPRTGSKRIKTLITVPDTVVASPSHYIGEKYQGGIIFYIDPTSSGKRGLIAAEFDTAIEQFYSNLSGSSSYTTGATAAGIGTGQANSNLMLANDAAKDDAVKYCDELIVAEYSDWYLPSELELDRLYFYRFKISNLGSSTYWSSTETAWNKARCLSFANGVTYTRDKNNRYSVRAIRSFDDNTLTNNKPVETLTLLNTRITFSTATPVNVLNGVLSLFIKSSKQWKLNTMLLIESYLGATKTGSVVISPSTGLYGYKSENPDWQLIAIQMTNFGSNRDTVDGFKISMVGAWPNNIDFAIDVVRYQYSKIDIKKDGETVTDYNFVESFDGSRTLFTTLKEYKPGTTSMTRNGIRQFIGSNEDYTETGGKIQLTYAPASYEKFIITYKTV